MILSIRHAQAVLRFLLLVLVTCCVAQPTRGPIAAIEFYGAAAVDFARLRAVFPVRVGEIFEAKDTTIQDQSPESQEFQEVISKNRLSVAPVFVPDLRGWVLYVDVEPPDTSPSAWNPRPTGLDKLRAKIVQLYEHAIHRYINGGIFAGDDTTNGYSLSKDPIMRQDELQLVKYARVHSRNVYSVLKRSASDRERIAAAWIAGYAHQSSDQLVPASARFERRRPRSTVFPTAPRPASAHRDRIMISTARTRRQIGNRKKTAKSPL